MTLVKHTLRVTAHKTDSKVVGVDGKPNAIGLDCLIDSLRSLAPVGTPTRRITLSVAFKVATDAPVVAGGKIVLVDRPIASALDVIGLEADDGPPVELELTVLTLA